MNQGKFISIHDKFLNLAESSRWPEVVKRFGMCSFIIKEGHSCKIETIICVPKAIPEKFTETSILHLLYMLDKKEMSTILKCPNDRYYKVTFEIVTGIHID